MIGQMSCGTNIGGTNVSGTDGVTNFAAPLNPSCFQSFLVLSVFVFLLRLLYLRGILKGFVEHFGIAKNDIFKFNLFRVETPVNRLQVKAQKLV
jgi:hypothetical protein